MYFLPAVLLFLVHVTMYLSMLF